MDKKIKVVIIDDDPEIIRSLSLAISLDFPNLNLFAVSDGKSAMDLINKEVPELILSDIKIPHIDGYQLCKHVRNDIELSNSYIILFTGITEENNLEKAIEVGADDYLAKPFHKSELISKIKAALRIIELQKNLRKENQLLKQITYELENDLENLKKIVIKLIQARDPKLSQIFHPVAKASTWIAENCKNFSEEDINNIELASFLCYSGKMFLPDDMFATKVLTNGIPTNDYMYAVPKNSYNIISCVDSLKPVAKIIQSIYENFDGTGIPNNLQSWQIPMSSRILRVALDFYENTVFDNKDEFEALKVIQKFSNRLYDNKIVVLFEQFLLLNPNDENSSVYPIKMTELKPNLQLANDIITHTGFKLIGKNTLLTEALIEKIVKHNTNDPILGYVMIKK